MKLIDISGIGHSGKTMVNDILSTNDRFHVHHPAFEFNLLRVFGGIVDLEYHLTEKWSPNRCDIALHNFKHLIDTISPKANIFNINSMIRSNGWNYNEMLQCEFDKISYDYLNSLISLNSELLWPYPQIYENSYKRLARKIGFRLFKYKKKHNFKLSDGKNFEELTRNYLEKVLSNNNKIICTNNMFEPYCTEKYFKFFQDPLSIIVWRDPRDIYVSTKIEAPYTPSFEKNNIVGKHEKSFTLSHDINAFIRRKKILINKCNFKESSRIHNIKFEDIVYDFERSILLIEDFLNIKLGNHKKIKKDLRLDLSQKNIGLWKKYNNQQEIDLIKKELSDYMAIFKYD